MVLLYVLLISFAVVFIESFFVALANFRLFFILNLSLFNKIRWQYLAVFSVLSSLILDVVYHYVLGTNLLLVGVSLLFFLGISLAIPIGYNLPGYSVKFVCIFLYYLLVAVIPNLILTGQWAAITGLMISSMVLKSVFSVFFCVVFDFVWGRLRKKEEGTKLRMQ